MTDLDHHAARVAAHIAKGDIDGAAAYEVSQLGALAITERALADDLHAALASIADEGWITEPRPQVEAVMNRWREARGR